MSALHRFRVTGGPHPAKLTPELDGAPLRGVVAFKVEADIRDQKRCVVTLTLAAQLDIDVNGETEILAPIAPTPWWAWLWPWGAPV